VVGQGRFVFCCYDLHRSNAEMMKQKKQKDMEYPVAYNSPRVADM